MHTYQAPEQLLANNVILVTGAGDGIGKAAALAYSDLGATVILLGKTVSKLESVYDAIVERGNPEPAIVPLDLKGASEKHYQDMANTIRGQFGRLDGVLFNASVLGHLEPFRQITQETWNDVMQVNVNSQFLLTQALLPLLEDTQNASVVYTTSTVGSQGRAFWGTYAVSKFATEGMMQVLADEYDSQNIRFNCINPGRTRTTMRAKAYPAEDPGTLRTPEDIMPLYCYLMGSDSLEVTGQTLKAQPDK